MSDDSRRVSESRVDELDRSRWEVARQLEHEGQCPLCDGTDIAERWYPAIPDGAVKEYECDCGLVLFVPEDVYTRSVEPESPLR